jgi:replication factor C subunit 3/5
MFLIDKYKINSIQDISFHKDIYKKLITTDKFYGNSNLISKKIDSSKVNLNNLETTLGELQQNNFQNFSNLLIYGPEGSGKKTLVKLLLNTMYNTDIKTNVEKYVITNYGNSNVTIEIKQSNYHIEIEPTNKGIDKYIIQDVIGQYIRYNGMRLFENKMKYRIVVINNIQNLSYYAQTSLRRMMEKYVKYCRFIIIGSQISKIIEPLKSRCVPIKLRAPYDYEIFDRLYDIVSNEKINISIDKLLEISVKADRNIKEGIWLLEMYKDLKIINYIENWKENIVDLINLIFKIKPNYLNTDIYDTINETIYKIYITTVPTDKILKELLDQTLLKIKNDIIAYDIVELAVKYDYRITNGKRSITHLEGFIYGIIYILNKPT